MATLRKVSMRDDHGTPPRRSPERPKPPSSFRSRAFTTNRGRPFALLDARGVVRPPSQPEGSEARTRSFAEQSLRTNTLPTMTSSTEVSDDHPRHKDQGTSRDSLPLGEISVAIVVSVYLTDTFRSQGFSPSQRLHPANTLWLYFKPLPPQAFRPSELLPLGQPYRLSATVALLPLPAG